MIDTKEEILMSEKIMGGVSFDGEIVNNAENAAQLPANIGLWPKVRAVLFHEIKVELTPRQEEAFGGLNEFLHIELKWQDFRDFLFQDISFGKKNK